MTISEFFYENHLPRYAVVNEMNYLNVPTY